MFLESMLVFLASFVSSSRRACFNYTRFFINLYFVLCTRIYCEDRKNYELLLNKMRKVMFLESMLVFLASFLKNYTRFFINLYFVLCTRIYCEDHKNFAYKIFITIGGDYDFLF